MKLLLLAAALGLLSTFIAPCAHAEEPLRKDFVFGLKTGWAQPVWHQFRLPPQISTSLDARIEGKRGFVELALGGTFSSLDDKRKQAGTNALGFEIGVSRYLTQTDTSPYIGGGGIIRAFDTMPVVVLGYGQAGIMFFRRASTRLYFELRAAQHLSPAKSMERVPGGFRGPTQLVMPLELGGNLGIGW